MSLVKMLVPREEVSRFIRDAFLSVEVCANHAQQMADVLVDADYKGHYSHGLNRLEFYLNDIKKKLCYPNAEPKILKESPATAWVDGCNTLGPIVGNFCMELAIKKAKDVGVGWVAVKNSNHFGIAGWYTRTAVSHGLMGMSFTNTNPVMCPTRANKPALGTNPLSLAAPAKDCDSFVLDMATTAVALGKIEIQQRKGEPIPEGWAQGPDGRTITSAEVALSTGTLLPLGGQEHTSGYKGYGLALLVETFTGILSGSAQGPHIRHWTADQKSPPNLGHCFVAIDPERFSPEFEERMSSMNNFLRGMEPTDPSKPVLVPGDPERLHMKTVDTEGGITYLIQQIESSESLAKELGITPLKIS